MRVLIVEDVSTDAELCEREIKKVASSCEFRVVETQEGYLAALKEYQPDFIVSDYRLPAFDGLTALMLAREQNPDTPFIILTGSMNEDTAVECMKAGAWDYVIKEHIKRLGPAFLSALEQKQLRLERQKNEETIRRTAEEWQRTFDSVNSVIWILDKQHRILRSNGVSVPFLNQSRDEIIGKYCWEIAHGTNEPITDCPSLRSQKTMKREVRQMKVGEKWWEISVDPLINSEGCYDGAVHIISDITERKQAEEKYRNIFDNAQEGIYQSTPGGRFILANQSMAQMLGYDSPEDLIAGITDISRQLYVDPDERKKFLEMMEQQEFARNNEVRFYKKDGSIIWVSRTMHIVRDENGRVQYYEGMIEDITERKESFERLRSALAGTVRAIASLVESRDPYTAGHQRNVADLARAIATEMGLSNDRIEGLRLAATIHDIGKISIPAEILSKPTKLKDIEFSIIKNHPESGSAIVKDIEFPWPVARMIIEHHERMNGSGYPNGLTGDKIMLESRILAVADVVEAMASHRPYRPSLGIESALEEIKKNKGVLYDNAVADACLKIFREKDYQFT